MINKEKDRREVWVRVFGLAARGRGVKMTSGVEGDVCDGGLVRFVKRARFAK